MTDGGRNSPSSPSRVGGRATGRRHETSLPRSRRFDEEALEPALCYRQLAGDVRWWEMRGISAACRVAAAGARLPRARPARPDHRREPIDGSGSPVSTGLSNHSPVRRCFVRYLTGLRTTRLLAHIPAAPRGHRPRSVDLGSCPERSSVPLDCAMSAVL